MASGQQTAVENYQKFLTWVSSKTDNDYKQMVYRGQLSRKEIATECHIGKSALTQNPQIKAELTLLENELRVRGVLPEKVVYKETDNLPLRDIDKPKNRQDSMRLSRLEQEATALRAENNHLKLMLEKYSLLDSAIAESGRMPR